MKRILLVLVSMLLVFGCVGEPAPGANVSAGNVSAPQSNETTTVPPADTGPGCTPSFQFTKLPEVTLGQNAVMTVTATCAQNSTLDVLINGNKAASSKVPAQSATLNFNLVASTDGTNTVVVQQDGTTVHSGEWEVNPIGFTDTSGTENDPISLKNRKAVAFTVSGKTQVKKVGAYLKRLSSLTLGSNIVAEIRQDSSGEPGSLVTSSTKPITSATLTPNWVYFPMDATLQSGRYWLVFTVDKPDDYVNIHYVAEDTLAKPNTDHMKMDLVKNEDLQVWEETQWELLSYDRNYAFIVSASGE